jgi:hypothetical protein
MADRQEIMATNKSLRLIKNELETLLERGVLTDEAFDSISRSLPAELSLSGSNAATPAQRGAVASPPPLQSPPIQSMANLAIQPSPVANQPPPPAYQSTGPPSLPSRNGPPPPPPSKPVLVHAKALYKYTAADDRDLSFERDDQIAVHEYMNDDWWMGRNARTGAEGIFPKNYVEVDHSAAYPAEKQNVYGAPAPGHMGYAAPPPAQQNPYDAYAPAPASNGSGSTSKMNEHGKKFGKKLGNAAVFGAGATIGSNIVNSIF